MIARSDYTSATMTSDLNSTATIDSDCPGTESTWITYTQPYMADLDLFLENILISAHIYNTQWILREGYKFVFNPPKLELPLTILLFRRILRCNRKGMGLRLRRDR